MLNGKMNTEIDPTKFITFRQFSWIIGILVILFTAAMGNLYVKSTNTDTALQLYRDDTYKAVLELTETTARIEATVIYISRDLETVKDILNNYDIVYEE